MSIPELVIREIRARAVVAPLPRPIRTASQPGGLQRPNGPDRRDRTLCAPPVRRACRKTRQSAVGKPAQQGRSLQPQEMSPDTLTAE